MSKNRRPKREKEYLLENILRNEKKKNKRKSDEKEQRNKNGEKGKKRAGELSLTKEMKGFRLGLLVLVNNMML